MKLAEAFRRLLSVARKEVRQLVRDPLTMGFVVGVPVVQLLLFGYAINQDVRHVRTALVDHSATAVSRRIVGQLEATQTFDVIRRLPREDRALQLLDKGDVDVVMVVPVNFACIG